MKNNKLPETTIRTIITVIVLTGGIEFNSELAYARYKWKEKIEKLLLRSQILLPVFLGNFLQLCPIFFWKKNVRPLSIDLIKVYWSEPFPRYSSRFFFQTAFLWNTKRDQTQCSRKVCDYSLRFCLWVAPWHISNLMRLRRTSIYIVVYPILIIYCNKKTR